MSTEDESDAMLAPRAVPIEDAWRTPKTHTKGFGHVEFSNDPGPAAGVDLTQAAVVQRLVDAGSEALREAAFVDPDDGTVAQFYAIDQWPDSNIRHWTAPAKAAAPVVVATLRELGKCAMVLRPAGAGPFVTAEDVRRWLIDAASQVLVVYPEPEQPARHPDPDPSWDTVEVLARILDPAAFDPASDVPEEQRPDHQATARTMAERAIDARYERRSGFVGCRCDSCLRATGRCPRCGRHDPVDETSLCATCEAAMAQEVTGTDEVPQPLADAAFAVLSPDGTVTWHEVDAEEDVERTVAGAYPGALERRWLGPSCPLKVMASDVSALHPDDFAVNTLARRVIRGLSVGYIEQPWRGPVAVYAHDEGYAEVMPREWVERVTRLAAG